MATNNGLNLNSSSPLSNILGGNGVSTGGSPSRYVVSPNVGEAAFQTVQSAINRAVSDGASALNPVTVWLFTGQYTENIILAPYVNLASCSDPSVEGVNIIGNCIYNGTGNLSITNIGFTSPNTSAALSFQSAGVATIHLQSVGFYCANGIGLECTSASSSIECSIGSFSAGAGGKNLNIQNGFLEAFSCLSSYVDTQSTISGGIVRMIGGDHNDSFNITGGQLQTLGAVIVANLLPCATITNPGTFIAINDVLDSSAVSNNFVEGNGDFYTSNVVVPGSAGLIQNTLSTAVFPTTPLKLITDPGPSQSSSLVLGAAYQNTTGIDITITVYLDVQSATTADILCGVGPTNTPTQQTIVNNLTTATAQILPVSIYLPTNYYVLLSTSGTIAVSITGQQAVPV